MARPTKYTKELLENAEAYLSEWEDALVTDGEEFTKVNGDVMPSHIGLFLYLDISRSNGYAWATQDDKKEFSDILDKCMAMQQQILISRGLTGDFNSAITKLVLGKHGYSDKVEQDLTSSDGSMTPKSFNDFYQK